MKKRSYKQNCSLAFAADLIGERWTLLIIRELLLAPRTYTEMMHKLHGIGTNLLATRLEELGDEHIIEKLHVPRRKSHRYALTDKGRALEPVILSLVRWHLLHGERHDRPDYFHDLDWDLLALKSLLKPTARPGRPITIGFRVGTWARFVSVSAEGYKMGILGAHTKVDAVWEGAIGSLRSVKKGAGGTPAPVVAFLECFEPI